MTRPLAPLCLLLAGCAVHPRGEKEERARAEARGEAYVKVFHERDLPPLAEDPSWEEVLRRAFLSHAELESRYWEWRAALEEIPQEGSPRTTGALFFDHLLEGGSATFWDRTGLAVGNDPMFNLPWPGKLATRARMALEKARAAGLRFEEAKFRLQEEVLEAYQEWALLAETIRLQESNISLLETIAGAAEGRTRAAVGLQQDLLKARTERDMAENELESLRAQVPGLRARLNALLSRPPRSPLALPATQPDPRPFPHGDAELLAAIAERNPEFSALAREVERSREGVRLARQEYLPEFGFSAGTDLGGGAQTLAGMVTLPLLRWEALRAGVAQARAELRAAEARRRQAGNDLQAAVVLDLQGLRDAERQTALFRDRILPRAEEIVATTRAAYTAGQVPLVELLDSQRTLLEVRTALAELRARREKLVARLEARAALGG
jgi:cobalt-zinc-cadmium efflux system outer membrane protein